jgi:uroporphyrinogen decarboxylase
MAYNHGCFISGKTFDQFLMPYYQELLPFLRSRGIQKILVDSDGNTVKLTDKLVEAGFDGHYPLEIKSGSYPEAIREKHPKLALIGGVDKLTLFGDKTTIDKELSKLPALLEKGGFIPALDHRVQPGVPMSNYQYYVDRKREILEKYCY